MGKKISELSGAELDKWVMLALGWEHCGAIGTNEPNDKGIPWCRSERNDWWKTPDGEFICGDCYCLPYPYSTDWSQCGPIIESEELNIGPDVRLIDGRYQQSWVGENYNGTVEQIGPTPLIAAMRAYVASVYGEEVPDA